MMSSGSDDSSGLSSSSDEEEMEAMNITVEDDIENAEDGNGSSSEEDENEDENEADDDDDGGGGGGGGSDGDGDGDGDGDTEDENGSISSSSDSGSEGDGDDAMDTSDGENDAANVEESSKGDNSSDGGWDEYVDPDTGSPYWVERSTGESTWDRPQELGAQLPEGWATAFDTDGNIYYQNVETGEAQWAYPTVVQYSSSSSSSAEEEEEEEEEEEDKGEKGIEGSEKHGQDRVNDDSEAKNTTEDDDDDDDEELSDFEYPNDPAGAVASTIANVEDAESKMYLLESVLEDRSKKLRLAKSAIAELEGKEAATSAEREKLLQDLNMIRVEHGEKISALRKAEEEKATSELERDKITSAIDELAANQVAVETELGRLSASFSAAKDELEKIEKREESLRKKVTDLEDELRPVSLTGKMFKRAMGWTMKGKLRRTWKLREFTVKKKVNGQHILSYATEKGVVKKELEIFPGTLCSKEGANMKARKDSKGCTFAHGTIITFGKQGTKQKLAKLELMFATEELRDHWCTEIERAANLREKYGMLMEEVKTARHNLAQATWPTAKAKETYADLEKQVNDAESRKETIVNDIHDRRGALGEAQSRADAGEDAWSTAALNEGSAREKLDELQSIFDEALQRLRRTSTECTAKIRQCEEELVTARRNLKREERRLKRLQAALSEFTEKMQQAVASARSRTTEENQRRSSLTTKNITMQRRLSKYGFVENEAEWVRAQRKAITKWANRHLEDAGDDFRIGNIYKDVVDSKCIILCKLLEIVSGLTFKSVTGRAYLRKASTVFQAVENAQQIITFCARQKIRLKNLGAKELVDGNKKSVLALMTLIVRHYSISSSGGLTGLLHWCRRCVENDAYQGLGLPRVKDFTRAWESGLTIVTILHSYFPTEVAHPKFLRCEMPKTLWEYSFDFMEQKFDSRR
eukprot:g2038.t1